MKSLFACFLLLITLLSASAQEAKKLIPYDDFYIVIVTKEAKNGNKLSVSLCLERFRGIEGDECIIEVRCPLLGEDHSLFNEAEIEALLSGKKAILGKKPYRRALKRAGSGKLTVFEIIENEGVRNLAVTRGGRQVILGLEDVVDLRSILAEAKKSKKWLEGLMAADKVPKETPDAKRPKGYIRTIIANLLETKGGDLTYYVDFEMFCFDGKEREYEINQGVDFGNEADGVCGEDFVNILAKMDQASVAITENREYLYHSDRHAVLDYLVATDLKKKQVVFSLSLVEKFKTPLVGTFTAEKIKKIHTAIDKYDERKKWFEENMNLFISDK